MLTAHGLYGHIRNNNIKSALLMAGFVGLFAIFWYSWCVIFVGLLWTPPAAKADTTLWIVWMILEEAGDAALEGWWVPLLLTAAWCAVAYHIQAGLIRAATGARPVTRKEQPRLYNLVENLAISAGLPVPDIEIMDSTALNAYAAGLSPDTATVAVTRGLLVTLDEDELEAVLAHEMAHIRNHDVRFMMVAGIFGGGLSLITDGIWKFVRGGAGNADVAGFALWSIIRRRGSSSSSSGEGDSDLNGKLWIAAAIAIAVAIVCLFLARLFALMSWFAISRTREFAADAGAAELTKNPDALVRALRKISGTHDEMDLPGPVQAMMFAYDADRWFATHPPIAARIDALATYAGATGAVRRGPIAARTAAAAPPSPWGRNGAPSAATGFASGTTPAFGRRRA